MLVNQIKIGERARADAGDIESLARSMRKLGQLQPIGVDADGVLVFGGRRLMAARSLGWAEIEARVIDCDALQAEHDENEIRKQFTVTERLAIAQRIAERLQGRHGGDRKTDQGGNISTLDEAGKTRDLAAAKAGLGSGKTLEAAQKVVERGVPELVEAMDAGKVSIHAAAELTSLPKEDQRRIDYSDRQQVKRAREQTKQKARIHIVIEYEDAHQGAEDLAATLIKRDAGFAAELRAALNFALGGS
jgi:ParB family chromosome partitioning protein